MVESNSTISELNLWGNKLSSTGIKSLSETLVETNLEILKFRKRPKIVIHSVFRATRIQMSVKYTLIKKDGLEHNPEFTVKVEIADLLPSYGIGKTLKKAEKESALLMLKKNDIFNAS